MIAEAKVEGQYVKIYDESGFYTGRFINIYNAELAGYNSNHIVIKENGYAKIYDKNGIYTGRFIKINGSDSIQNITPSNILIREGIYTKYYSFDGIYTGRFTKN